MASIVDGTSLKHFILNVLLCGGIASLPNANNFAALCKIDRNILVLSCVAAS